MDNWNELVSPIDIVLHLGDVFLGRKEDWEKYIPSLPGIKILTIGSHDNNSYSWYLNNGFHFVCQSFILKRFGYSILFSHEPQLDFKGCDYNIHGHLHTIKTHTSEHYTDKHLLFSLEHENYQPRLLKGFLNEKTSRNRT